MEESAGGHNHSRQRLQPVDPGEPALPDIKAITAAARRHARSRARFVALGWPLRPECVAAGVPEAVHEAGLGQCARHEQGRCRKARLKTAIGPARKMGGGAEVPVLVREATRRASPASRSAWPQRGRRYWHGRGGKRLRASRNGYAMGLGSGRRSKSFRKAKNFAIATAATRLDGATEDLFPVLTVAGIPSANLKRNQESQPSLFPQARAQTGLGNGHRQQRLHRLQRLRDGLPGREQHPRRRARGNRVGPHHALDSHRSLRAGQRPWPVPRRGFEPVPCMQCEKARCEPVCPVAASVHDSEGLNLQVYNRCVGTRFCEGAAPIRSGASTSSATPTARNTKPRRQVLRRRRIPM